MKTMKTIKALCLIAVLAAAAACGRSSNDDKKATDVTAPTEAASPSSAPVMKLGATETSIGSAVAYLQQGMLVGAVSEKTEITCEALRNRAVAYPTTSYVSISLPAKVANYGNLDLAGLIGNQMVFGFISATGYPDVARQATVNVTEITDQYVTLELNAASPAQTEYLKGTLTIAICPL